MNSHLTLRLLQRAHALPLKTRKTDLGWRKKEYDVYLLSPPALLFGVDLSIEIGILSTAWGPRALWLVKGIPWCAWLRVRGEPGLHQFRRIIQHATQCLRGTSVQRKIRISLGRAESIDFSSVTITLSISCSDVLYMLLSINKDIWKGGLWIGSGERLKLLRLLRIIACVETRVYLLRNKAIALRPLVVRPGRHG